MFYMHVYRYAYARAHTRTQEKEIVFDWIPKSKGSTIKLVVAATA